MPQDDKGTVTLSQDDLIPTQVSVAPIDPTTGSHGDPSALKLQTPPSPGWWDKVNKGLISPDSFLRWATGGKYKSIEDLEKVRDQPPDLKETPSEAFSRTFHSGFTSDLAKTASSLTSPVSLVASAAGQAARLPGTIGKVARGLLAGQGIAYGVSGAGDISEGVKKGALTPEGSQEILGGASQVAGAAPAVAQVGRYARGAMAEIVPKLFAKGEDAFIAAVAPSGRKENMLVKKLRSAYQYHANELKNAPNLNTLEDVRDFAEVSKSRDIQLLESELKRVAPQNTTIDRFQAADAIRKRVDPAIRMSNPTEAKAIMDYADRVQQEFFEHPKTLAEADQLIVKLNQKSIAFDNMSDAQKLSRLANGDPILGEKALKIALQDQIESKIAFYKYIKQSWGHWNEIQDQVQNAIDENARKSGKPDLLQRRAAESLFSAAGIGAGYFGTHGSAEGGIAGGAMGYLLAKFAAEQTLIRLSAPENTLARGLRPSGPSTSLNFRYQAVQPAASNLAGQTEGGLGKTGDPEIDKILDQMLGPANAK